MPKKLSLKVFLYFLCLFVAVGISPQFQSGIAATVPEPPPSPKKDVSNFRTGVEESSCPSNANFGYTYKDSEPPVWVDANGGVKVEFLTDDDDYFGPVDLGFEFKFYENSYSEIFISTNGLVNFGSGNDDFVNRSIPMDTTPNNYIAPFWDDLILLVDEQDKDISQVFYQSGEDPVEGKYFVVEWEQIARLGTQDLQTFEVILYEDGDIRFQYQELNGDLANATVGTEGEHGVDGLCYRYNAPGLSVGKAIEINRPDPSHRVKIFPAYFSDFVVRGKTSLEFTVRNTGDLVPSSPESFNLNWTSSDTDWLVSFVGPDGNQLADTNQDGKIDTGPLEQGEDFKIEAKIQTPEGEPVGGQTQIIVTVSSSKNPNKSDQTRLQSAVPAPFAQVLSDGLSGMRLKLIWRVNEIDARTSGLTFTGSNLTVVSLADGKYIYSWEKNEFPTDPGEGVPYTNLEYMIFYPFGEVYQTITTLTDNQSADLWTEDRFASLVGTHDNHIGSIWVRNVISESLSRNQNVYITIRKLNGQAILDQKNLTNNTAWRGKDDLDVPLYVSPRIVATNDNHFVMAWIDDRKMSGGNVSDVVYAVYDQDGGVIKAPVKLTNSVPGGARYSSPALVSLNDYRVLLVYNITPGDGSPSTLAYQVLGSGGKVLHGETLIPGSEGSTPDGIQLSSGYVLLAWNNPAIGNAAYALLDVDNYEVKSGPHTLENPDGHEMDVVSVSRDAAGHGILTWGDASQTDYLYYALVGGQGALLTPEMIFYKGGGVNASVVTNAYGLGNASYEGWYQLFKPAVFR